MHVTKSLVFGLLSLVCAVDAIKVTGTPVLAKRQAVVTVTNNGCTAVCEDHSNILEGMACDIYCSGGFSTTILATPMSAEAALKQRKLVSAVNGDCTAICWDLMPGTECDVKCSSDFKTKMPGNVAHPGGANDFHRAPTSKHKNFLVPSKAARVANLEARDNVQAHQAHEARLARKFGGVVARDDIMTVTVTSIPEYCITGLESISTTVAGVPTILPVQMPQEVGAFNMSAAMSQASAALSLVLQAQGGSAAVLPSAASAALSEASAFLSSVAATAPISANATVAMPASTGFAPTVSATATATSTSSETTTASATTTGSPVVSETGTPSSTIVVASGAGPEHAVLTGLGLSLLGLLAGSVVFLI